MLRIRLDRFCLNSLGVLAFGTPREPARRILTGLSSTSDHPCSLPRPLDEDHSLASYTVSRSAFFLLLLLSFLPRFFTCLPSPHRGGSFAPRYRPFVSRRHPRRQLETPLFQAYHLSSGARATTLFPSPSKMTSRQDEGGPGLATPIRALIRSVPFPLFRGFFDRRYCRSLAGCLPRL